MLLMIQLLRVAGGLGSWIVYSRFVKIAVAPAARCNAIISQTRSDANATLMAQLAGPLPSRRPFLTDSYDACIWRPSEAAIQRNPYCSKLRDETVTSGTDGAVEKLLGTHMILRGDGSIFADKPIPQVSLRNLIGSKHKGKIVKEPFQFRTWMEALARSKPVTTAKQSRKISGKYSYSFRDYWNFEECCSLEAMRGSINILKLRGQRNRPTELIIDEGTGACTLTDYYVYKAVIPMYIQWKGTLRNGTITWNHTMLHKGWKRWLWGRTVDRPPMSEKFRQQPWIVSLPTDDTTGDLIVLNRVGIGRLLFARDVAFP